MLPAGLVLFVLLALLQTPEAIPRGSHVDPCLTCLSAFGRTESAEPAQFADGSAMTSGAAGLATGVPFEARWAIHLGWLPVGSPPLPGHSAEIHGAEPVAAEDSAIAYLMILVAFVGLGVNVNRKWSGIGSEYAEADHGPTDCGLPLGC